MTGLTKQNFDLVVQPTNINKKKGKNEREFWTVEGMQLDQKKAFAYFSYTLKENCTPKS